jgi:hypothetical protein
VEIAGKERHVNRWLVEQGWALPGLYNSMSADEIAGLIEAATSAYENDLGVWPSFADTVGALDWKMVFRGKGEPPQPDGGDVLVCVFRSHLNADSGGTRALIPMALERVFRRT